MEWIVRILMIYLLVSGVSLVVSVEQPSVLTASVGQDVTLPCHLKVSSNDILSHSPILYWLFDGADQEKLWPPSEKYRHRVALLDEHPQNRSIRFKHVRWEDRGKYLCKVSVTTQQEGSVRKKGREMELLLYDKILFHTTGLNNSVLQCGVHVSQNPGFELSISQSGQTLNFTSGQNATSLHYVTLFQTISLENHQKYLCSLHFNGELVTSSIFQLSGETGLVDETVTSCISCSEERYPEPWFLYGGLILVQVLYLSVLTIAMLRQICC